MKHKLLLTGVLAAGALALHAADQTLQDTRPNILFILSDDHTSQTWACMEGYWSNMPRQTISGG